MAKLEVTYWVCVCAILLVSQLTSGWFMANAKASPNLQALPTSPFPVQSLSSEAVFDALKMILIGAPLNDVLRSVALLIEAHTERSVCSIFLLDEDGHELRYAAPPQMPY